MSRRPSGRTLALSFLSGLGAYAWLQRRALRGGATRAEAIVPLPGDPVIPDPTLQTTHGITIDAPPDAVWPWLVQAGYRGSGRAGWYADSRLDPLWNAVYRVLVPAEHLPDQPAARSATVILPELQHLEEGDTVPDGPPGSAWFEVRRLEHERALVLYSDSHIKFLVPTVLQGTRFASHGDFTWTFVLEPLAGDRTRLLLRTRARIHPRWLRALMPVFYVGEAIFPARILQGIKARAEGRAAPTQVA